MTSLEAKYFEWLLRCIDPNGVPQGVEHVAQLLQNAEFHRRVGNDINRAIDGADLRKEFLTYYDAVDDFDQESVQRLMMRECSWLEMLVALCRHLDYLYEGGVDGRFVEIVNNMKLGHLAGYSPHMSRTTMEYDQHLVDHVTSAIDHNAFTKTGHGGMFPLNKSGHDNQREVEIWNQQAAYFRERLEGVLWTSTT